MLGIKSATNIYCNSSSTSGDKFLNMEIYSAQKF